MPPFADGRPARLELRLDQSHQPSAQARRASERPEAPSVRLMKLTSATMAVTSSPITFRSSAPRVGAFQDHDPRVHPELGVELAAANINRIDFGRAARDQHIGEAAGRGADIERYRTLRGRSRRHRAPLRASARRARRSGAAPGLTRELGIRSHLRARLQRGDARHADQTPPHQVGGTRAGRRQAAVH